MLKLISSKGLNLGDQISFKATLRLPMENTNPKLFNYKLNLYSNKIYVTSTIKDKDILAIKANSSFKYEIRRSFRNKLIDTFEGNLKDENASLVLSMLLGDYSYMEEEDLLNFRDLGLAHILAVSGLHIGIISSFLIYFLSFIGIKRKYTSIVTLSLIWTYGYLIGFPPSLLRANIMLTIFLWAFSYAEYYDLNKSLFIAFIISFLINPMIIFSLSFQLSFLATFSIINFTLKIRDYLYPLGNKVSSLFSGVLAVHLGLFPLQIYYFNKISLLAILVNVIMTPILSLSLVIASIMIGFSFLLPIVNTLILGKILDIILSSQFFLLRLFHEFDFTLIKLHSPDLYEFIYYYIGLLILFKFLDLKDFDLKFKKTILYFLIFVFIINSFLIFTDKSMEIHFVDVGQGDCIFIRSREGNYLIDTGGNILDGFDIGKNITLPYLEKLGVKTLDGVFISHFHEDHAKSLSLLMDNIKIKPIFISYENYESQIKAGDRLVLNKYTSIDVLSPKKEDIKKLSNENNLSLVLKLKYFDTSILLTGDMEKEVEYELINKLGRIDIIKVPHHGSNTSSSEDLLQVLQPRYGIIQVGRNNFHGHPNKEVIARYGMVNTKIYRTDNNGMIKIKLDRNKLSIIPFIKEG